jgi:hypothetical protein
MVKAPPRFFDAVVRRQFSDLHTELWLVVECRADNGPGDRKAFHSDVADATRWLNRLPEEMVVLPRFVTRRLGRPHFHPQDSTPWT